MLSVDVAVKATVPLITAEFSGTVKLTLGFVVSALDASYSYAPMSTVLTRVRFLPSTPGTDTEPLLPLCPLLIVILLALVIANVCV